MALRFKKGDTVWANMNGFPFWPGIITEPLKEMKKSAKDNMRCVYFFGSKNYSWIDLTNLNDYKTYKDIFENSNKSAAFKSACADIEDYLKQGDTSLNINEEDPFDILIGASNTPDIDKKPSSENAKRWKTSFDETSTTPGKLLKYSHKEKKTDIKEKNIDTKKKNSLSNDILKPDSKSKENKVLLSETILDSSNFDLKSCFIFPSPARSFSIIESSFGSRESVIDSLDVFDQVEELPEKKIKATNQIIGFIGLGEKSAHYLRNIVQSKHRVILWSERDKEYENAFRELGVVIADSPLEVVQAADISIFCLANDTSLFDIVYGPNLVPALIIGNKKFVNITNISNELSENISDLMQAYRCGYLEIRALGAIDEAERGTLYCIIAGDKPVYDACKSFILAISRKHTFLGSDLSRVCQLYALSVSLTNIVSHSLLESFSVSHKVDQPMPEVLEVVGSANLFSAKFTDKINNFDERDGTLPAVSSITHNVLCPLLKEMNSEGMEVPVTAIAFELQK